MKAEPLGISDDVAMGNVSAGEDKATIYFSRSAVPFTIYGVAVPDPAVPVTFLSLFLSLILF